MSYSKSTFFISAKHKIFFYILNFLLCFIIAFALIEFVKQGDIISVIVYILPLIILVTLNFLHILKSKIKLTDNFIEKYFISIKRIYFNDIEKIIVRNSSITLKDKNKVINVTGDFENRNEIIDFIIAKIKGSPKLEIKGFQSAINKYFEVT